MNVWWTLQLKRELASVPLARRVLVGTLESAGVDPQIAHDLGLALTEACANAVEHTEDGRTDDGFQVTARLAGDLLRIEVVDSGPGLPAAPHLVPPLCTARPHRPTAHHRPAAHPRPLRRRGRASLPGPPAVLGPAHRPRHGAYDTHVLPAVRPVPAGPRPADLDAVPDLAAESGRGLFLIRALTDHVQLSNHPQRGAIVSFDKLLRPPGATVLRVAS